MSIEFVPDFADPFYCETLDGQKLLYENEINKVNFFSGVNPNICSIAFILLSFYDMLFHLKEAPLNESFEKINKKHHSLETLCIRLNCDLITWL